MAIVYVTQETEADFSLAEKWGQIEFLTKDDFNNTARSLRNEELVNRLTFLLRGFDNESDRIVIAGSPYVSAAVFMILGRRFNCVPILRWDNRDRIYRPMQIEIPFNDRR